MKTYFIEFSYLLASILFVLGLRGLSHPDTARRGMHLAEFGMAAAVVGTLLQKEIISYEWIIAGLLLGLAATISDRLWPFRDVLLSTGFFGLLLFVLREDSRTFLSGWVTIAFRSKALIAAAFQIAAAPEGVVAE